MTGVYISRVQIKNFRNFKNIDVSLSTKQVIIGENNCGKTNFLRAIQLILDPSFSDLDRQLSESDFHDSLEEPMKTGEIIEIAIEIKGFEINSQLVAIFTDGVISDDPQTIRITYQFKPDKDELQKIIGYSYKIFLGTKEDCPFSYHHRSYINIQVIKALRDVEREMKSLKKSPIYRLVSQYDIDQEELKEIANELQAAADTIMKLDEIVEIQRLIHSKFKSLSGTQPDCDINLSTFDIDPMRLLYALQALIGIKQRPVSEISLGLCNILYIALMLLLIRDRTIPSIISDEKYNELISKDKFGLMKQFYAKNEKGKFMLNTNSNMYNNYSDLYTFMNKHFFQKVSHTILAVEEPEAHLHPAMQRNIYREVLHKSETSVIFTTHSTHLTSVAPIETLVHVKSNCGKESDVLSASTMSISIQDKEDLERYLDARRGEIYFGSAVILVEGIAEEYLIPKFAALMGHSLDNYRIVVCNINSTNFLPYVQLLQKLSIPWCLITDGDCYQIEDGKKYFHTEISLTKDHGFNGLEICRKLLNKLSIANAENISALSTRQRKIFMYYGCFVGRDTLEIDIMKEQKIAGINIFKRIFKEVGDTSVLQQKNFDNLIDNSEYWKVLARIESPIIGKGRFAQRLSSYCIEEQIPAYIRQAIEYIVKKVTPNE